MGFSIPIAGVSVLALAALTAAAPYQTPGEEATDRLFLIVLVPAIVIGVLVQLLLVVAIVRFRKRKGHATPPANPKVHDAKLEAAWTVAPAVILAIVGLFTFQALQVTDAIPDDPDVVVRVVAHQWAWNFEVTENNTTRMSTGEFTVKVGQTVVLHVESADVAHSIWIVDFGLKVDALPGRRNVVWFQALDPGDYVIRCAEFCGVGHSAMVATIHVVAA